MHGLLLPFAPSFPSALPLGEFLLTQPAFAITSARELGRLLFPDVYFVFPTLSFAAFWLGSGSTLDFLFSLHIPTFLLGRILKSSFTVI